MRILVREAPLFAFVWGWGFILLIIIYFAATAFAGFLIERWIDRRRR